MHAGDPRGDRMIDQQSISIRAPAKTRGEWVSRKRSITARHSGFRSERTRVFGAEGAGADGSASGRRFVMYQPIEPAR
ncbi:hypothetical protein ZHAS_00017696 [Anopheles sinensis]|uniref:Uncharacterized protein n=1 Tax=Anopheles sinensis TaxID=74873 RepID=A0A084WH00_ANOSI|nr:hypothetical protein ZHAS_00017696 [Anopheles sinensis]